MSGAPLRLLHVDTPALLEALVARDAAILGSVLDLRTGRVFQLLDPALTGADNESVELAMDQEPARYAGVPRFDREYRLMCAFVDEVEDEDLATSLDQALRGTSAFRGFQGIVGSHHEVSTRWQRYRTEALLRWATAWLRTLGVAPSWEGVVEGAASDESAEPRLAPLELHHLLLLGGVGPDDAVARREITASSTGEARRLFERFARQLCEYRGEPWRRAWARDTDVFERDGARLTVDGARVALVIELEPGILASFRR